MPRGKRRYRLNTPQPARDPAPVTIYYEQVFKPTGEVLIGDDPDDFIGQDMLREEAGWRAIMAGHDPSTYQGPPGSVRSLEAPDATTTITRGPHSSTDQPIGQAPAPCEGLRQGGRLSPGSADVPATSRTSPERRPTSIL